MKTNPCPNCGRVPICSGDVYWAGMGKYAIKCPGCNVTGPLVIGAFRTKEDAADDAVVAWNQAFPVQEKNPFEDLAHEILVTAQLLPGEGVEDGVGRIAEILVRESEDNLNEIERLSGELERAHLTQNEEATRFRNERDEVRRDLCIHSGVQGGQPGEPSVMTEARVKRYAKDRGWGYLFE